MTAPPLMSPLAGLTQGPVLREKGVCCFVLKESLQPVTFSNEVDPNSNSDFYPASRIATPVTPPQRIKF